MLRREGKLSTPAGRAAVLCAQRVESAGSHAEFVSTMRVYRAALAEATGNPAYSEPESQPVESPPSAPEGGDDDEPKRPAGSTASTLTLVS